MKSGDSNGKFVNKIAQFEIQNTYMYYDIESGYDNTESRRLTKHGHQTDRSTKVESKQL